MQEVLSILNTATPFGVIGLLVVVVYQLVVGKGYLSKVSTVQDVKYPELDEHLNKIQKHMEELDFVYAEQQKFRTNHSMHEIPEIRDSINRIEKKVDKLADMQYTMGLDVARLKALNEK